MRNKNNTSKYCFPTFATKTTNGLLAYSKPNNDSIDTLVQEAEQKGYTAGFEKGKNESMLIESQKLSPMMTALAEAKASINRHMANRQADIERDAIQLAVSVARNMLQHHINRKPEPTLHIIRSAISMAMGQPNLRIKTHPEDSEAVRVILQDMIPDASDEENVDIVVDRNIDKGGCLVHSDFGTIDARIDQQLSTIALNLTADSTLGTKNHPAHSSEQNCQHFTQRLKTISPIQSCGHVTKVVGLVIETNGPVAQLGTLCDIYGSDKDKPITAEVLGFRDQTVLMMPLEDIHNISPGSRVVARQTQASVSVGQHLLGRVMDGLGNPIDGGGSLATEESYPIYAQPINPLLRKRIKKPLDMGIRSINGLLTVGCGQRMGIFAGSGVGKSVLMGMIARKSCADVNVIALIGERGRELNEFIEKELGEEGLKKTVVVVATSDHLPLVRVRGAFVATTIAEYFRDQGLHVNLMMDSLTRFAMAQREIGLALGEPPTTKGYTPSVLTMLPKLLERAGTSDHNGSITGLYTVLVEGDDMNEPIADAARSILDGHIVLTRELSDHNHYPAIDVLASISRVMDDIAGLQHKHNAGQLKELLATHRKAEDLINIGAYVPGSNKDIDRAIEKIDDINRYLRQDMSESVNFEDSVHLLEKIMDTGA